MEKKQNTRLKYYAVLDIEAHTNVDVTAIGLVVADNNFKVYIKKEWWFICDERKIAKSTRDEFWSKYMEVWRKGQKMERPEEEQIKDFVETIDTLGEKLGIDEGEIIFVSDNPEFDFGRLSPYLKHYCNREPIRYRKNGKSRPIIDYTDAMWKLGVYKHISSKVDVVKEADHFPSNDAYHNWLVHMISEEVLESIAIGVNAPVGFIAEACSDKVLLGFVRQNRTVWKVKQ